MQKTREIDQFDERLLRALEQNSRATSIELAEAVGLSASSCQRRQRELERQGVIRSYRVDIDPEVLGQSFTVFAASRAERCSKLPESGCTVPRGTGGAPYCGRL